MTSKILWLRISYWAGAVADGLLVVPMLSPKIGGRLFGISDFNPGNDYRYAMGVGASLMLGWTFLLIWADRKPVERKGILLLTVFPVIFGLVIAGIYAFISNLITMERMIPTWIFQGAAALLFLFSYVNARDIEQN